MTRSSTRPYRKRKRAEAEEDTRRRITEAAVELHGTVGPASATITEIANLAGVSRMTVYNHFPTEIELFTACSMHWASENPFPDPTKWDLGDPVDRLLLALDELYEWYGLKQTMLEKVLRDTPNVPALAEVMHRLWDPWMDGVVAVLADGWSTPDADALDGALRVAAGFNTWRILTESGLDGARAAKLMARLVSGIESGC